MTNNEKVILEYLKAKDKIEGDKFYDLYKISGLNNDEVERAATSLRDDGYISYIGMKTLEDGLFYKITEKGLDEISFKLTSTHKWLIGIVVTIIIAVIPFLPIFYRFNDTTPNLIMDGSNISNAGYTSGSALAYFTIDVIQSNDDYIDFLYNFINDKIIDEIYCLTLKIYKIADNKMIYYLGETYYPKKMNNVIRINNITEKGQYEINLGFIFKKDVIEEYPKTHSQKKIIKR